MIKKMILTLVVLAGSIGMHPAMAENFSANLGYNSEYIFRGIPQKTSSAFAGLDWETGGFSLGTWAADVGDGLEVDLYGAYGFEVGDWGFSVGGTYYTYTGDFDEDYLELNLGASWKFLSFDAAIGTYDTKPSQDYQFYSVTASHAGFYGKFVMFAGDFDGNYYEAGYGNSLDLEDTYLFDYAIAAIYSDSTLLGGESDTNLVFTISRSFSF
jgi:uncharacterized protein (TIGR02001 family)